MEMTDIKSSKNIITLIDHLDEFEYLNDILCVFYAIPVCRTFRIILPSNKVVAHFFGQI